MLPGQAAVPVSESSVWSARTVTGAPAPGRASSSAAALPAFAGRPANGWLSTSSSRYTAAARSPPPSSTPSTSTRSSSGSSSRRSAMASSSVSESSRVERLNICPVIRNSRLMWPSTELGVACMNSSGLWTRPATIRRLARSAVVVSPIKPASATAVREPPPLSAWLEREVPPSGRSARHCLTTSYASGLNADSTKPGSLGSAMSSGPPVPWVAVALARMPRGERGTGLSVVTAAPARVRCWRPRRRR